MLENFIRWQYSTLWYGINMNFKMVFHILIIVNVRVLLLKLSFFPLKSQPQGRRCARTYMPWWCKFSEMLCSWEKAGMHHEIRSNSKPRFYLILSYKHCIIGKITEVQLKTCSRWGLRNWSKKKKSELCQLYMIHKIFIKQKMFLTLPPLPVNWAIHRILNQSDFYKSGLNSSAV